MKARQMRIDSRDKANYKQFVAKCGNCQHYLDEHRRYPKCLLSGITANPHMYACHLWALKVS